MTSELYTDSVKNLLVFTLFTRAEGYQIQRGSSLFGTSEINPGHNRILHVFRSWFGLYLTPSSEADDFLRCTPCAVSEQLPYAFITRLGSLLRIVQSITFLPSTRSLPCLDISDFSESVVVMALRRFPHPGVLPIVKLTSRLYRVSKNPKDFTMFLPAGESLNQLGILLLCA